MQRMLAKNYHWSRKTGSHDDNRLYFLYVTMRIVYDLTVLLVDQTAILVAGRLCRCMGTKSSLASQPPLHILIWYAYIYIHIILLLEANEKGQPQFIVCVYARRLYVMFLLSSSSTYFLFLLIVFFFCLFSFTLQILKKPVWSRSNTSACTKRWQTNCI